MASPWPGRRSCRSSSNNTGWSPICLTCRFKATAACLADFSRAGLQRPVRRSWDSVQQRYPSMATRIEHGC